ncbi:MAG: cupin domain-containing protein [Acidimicrobiia bacterium]|nr:cupin domain-containing protein [Acidimicrobiia bacterium]
MAGYVTHVDEVEPVIDNGRAVSTRTTVDVSTGAERLVQTHLTFAAATSSTRKNDDQDEIAYVVSGSGDLLLNGETYPLKPDLGVFIRTGETHQITNHGTDDLVLVSVTAPSPPSPSGIGDRKVTVDIVDQPVIPAGKNREFKFVINPDAGCAEVTQFVGWIPPGRAPSHYHLYDEVMYILDGDGILHLDGHPDTPISTGTCIHLPPPVAHCVENTGDRPLRVLGVFHPAGDASEAYETSEEKSEE